MEAKPFVKWAGGKGRLLGQLDSFLPQQMDGRPFTYIEPFVGGGAMLFHMIKEHPEIRRVVINDINIHLITAYRVIKEHPDELIKNLLSIENQYYALNNEDSKKDFYLEARTVFNEEKLDDINRVKYLIFLNRTCFNGLYRENAKGKFNVPFGRNIHPTICSAETIIADSEALNQVDTIIMNGDFSEISKHIEDGMNFIYMDPPYRPLNATSSFNSYVKEVFDDGEQIRLRDFTRELNNRHGVYWMLSNADCSSANPEDKFFETIYGDFYINRVFASRFINANPAKRGKLTELLICNYSQRKEGLYAAEDDEPYN